MKRSTGPAAGALLVINHNMRFHPSFRRLRAGQTADEGARAHHNLAAHATCELIDRASSLGQASFGRCETSVA